MDRTKIVAVLIVVLIAITITMGCVGKNTTIETEIGTEISKGNFTVMSITTIEGRYLFVVHDDDRNVTLWLYGTNEGKGITSQPDRI